jgi:hypothetical protein
MLRWKSRGPERMRRVLWQRSRGMSLNGELGLLLECRRQTRGRHSGRTCHGRFRYQRLESELSEGEEISLAITFLACRYICDDESDTRWRCNRTSVLHSSTTDPNDNILNIHNPTSRKHTLSPKPHILARRGCCTTHNLSNPSARTLLQL